MREQAKRSYRRLTPSQWAEAEGLWASGEVTLADLSERYGPSIRGLQSHFAKVGITKGEAAAALSATVRESVVSEVLAEPDDLAELAKDVRERAFRNATRVEALVMAQLELAERDPTQAVRISAGLKALSLAAGALERLHGLKLRALGLDRADAIPAELPVLEIVGMDEDRIKEIRDAQNIGEDDFGSGFSVHNPTPTSTGKNGLDEDVIALGDD